jgi:polyisoprenoid-binding protein YceI
VTEKFGLMTAHGTIPVVAADVTLDADGLPRGTATLDASRLDTGNVRRDKDLNGSRFFDTAAFPLVDFHTVSTRRTDASVVVDGLLTIRGEDCPLSLATTLTHQPDGTVAVHATGTFDRMTSPLRRAPRWLISASVDVVVDAVLHPVRSAR